MLRLEAMKIFGVDKNNAQPYNVDVVVNSSISILRLFSFSGANTTIGFRIKKSIMRAEELQGQHCGILPPSYPASEVRAELTANEYQHISGKEVPNHVRRDFPTDHTLAPGHCG
jgi:hypothetical protein